MLRSHGKQGIKLRGANYCLWSMPLSNYDAQERGYASRLMWKRNNHLWGNTTGVYIVLNVESRVSELSFISYTVYDGIEIRTE